MNERLQELKSQAYQYADRNTQDGDNRFATLQLEKFAELIIKESVKFLSDCDCEFEAEQLQEFWNDE
jgi:hypothetical protein